MTLPLLLLLLLVVGTIGAWKLLEQLASLPPAALELGGAASRDSTSAPTVARSSSTASRSLEPSREAVERVAAAPSSSTPPPLFPIDRRRADLVLDTVDEAGRSIEGALVELASTPGGSEPGLEIGDDRALAVHATSDANGRATFSRLPQGCYRLRARTRDGLSNQFRFVFRAAAKDPLAEPLTVVLHPVEPSHDLVVLVVGRDGAPATDAIVQLFGQLVSRIDDHVETELEGRSGANGRVRFRDVDCDGALVLARTQDGRVGTTFDQSRELERVEGQAVVTLRVVVDAGASLEGELVGVGAALLAGSTIHVDLRTTQHPYDWTFGTSVDAPVVGNRFRVEGLPRATVDVDSEAGLRLDSPRGVRLVANPESMVQPLENSARAPTVELEPGKTTRVELPVALGATIRGRVTTSDGEPVANALVRETFAPLTSNFPDGYVLRGVNVWRFDSDPRGARDHPFTHTTTRTDARGEYALAGLQPGRHRVEVTAPRLSLDRREGVAVADGATVVLDHVLAPAGVLQGVAGDSGYLGVTPVGSSAPFGIAVIGVDHSFTFAGLPAGEYALAAFHSNPDVEPVELARATVEAGRTTWVDLLDAPGRFVLAGRVVDAKGPIEGARVKFDGTTRRTGPDGRFEFALPFELRGSFTLKVALGRVVELFDVGVRGPATDGRWDEVLFVEDERLEVVALDSRGAASDATVRIADSTDEFPSGRVRLESEPIALGASGRATIDHLPARTLDLAAEFPDGARAREKVTLPRDGPLVLHAPACGTVEAFVHDEAGRPLRQSSVAVGTYCRDDAIPDDVGGHDEWFDWTWSTTDSAGRAVVRGVRAGRLLVRVDDRSRCGVTERFTTTSRRIALNEGETASLDIGVAAHEPSVK